MDLFFKRWFTDKHNLWPGQAIPLEVAEHQSITYCSRASKHHVLQQSIKASRTAAEHQSFINRSRAAPSLLPRPLRRGPGTHCMRMRVISVVTPTGFEEARAEFANRQRGRIH